VHPTENPGYAYEEIQEL